MAFKSQARVGLETIKSEINPKSIADLHSEISKQKGKNSDLLNKSKMVMKEPEM